MSAEQVEAKARAATIATRMGAMAFAGAGALARAMGRGASAAARGSWRRREALVEVLTRIGWWGALLAWWSAAVALLGGGPLDLPRARLLFVAGAVACAVVVAASRARRLRWLGGALGSLHGGCAVVLWFVIHA
jgi:hypothetical protein